jgi:hypothetical protein
LEFIDTTPVAITFQNIRSIEIVAKDNVILQKATRRKDSFSLQQQIDAIAKGEGGQL